MKKTYRKSIVLLIILMFGVQGIQAQGDQCLWDALTDELIAGSEDVVKHFEDHMESAYDAWRILYKSDQSANRLDVASLKEVSEYATSSTKVSDHIIKEIKTAGGYSVWRNTALVPTPGSYKRLAEDIQYRYEDPDRFYHDFDSGEIHNQIQKLLKDSELPDPVKVELAKIDDFKILRSVIDLHAEKLFNNVSSTNTELVEYAMFLIKGRIADDFDYKTYLYLVAEAEKVFDLPVVNATQRINSSGYRGAFFDGELNGTPVVFKNDVNPTDGSIDEIEKILKDLEPFGGPTYHGRYRVQLENGAWREVVGMEKINGYDIKSIEARLANGENIDKDNIGFTQVTEMHLRAIDDIEESLRIADKRLIEDINLGDFILTNNPDRPIVMIDLLMTTGKSERQGLITSGTNTAIRDIILNLINR